MTDQTGSAAGGQPGGAPAAGGNPAPWFGAEADADTKAFVESKGWDSPTAAIRSYRQLEQYLGADKAGRGVVWPKDEADAEGWAAIRSRLGVPEKPDGYKLEVPEGEDGAFAKAAAPILHELGISAKQAEGLVKFVNDYAKTQREQFETGLDGQVRQQAEDLEREWGAAYKQNMEVARRGARALGLEEADLDAMETSLGYKRTIEVMNKIGQKLGEDTFAGEGGQPRALSPAAAGERLNQLRADQDWVTRVLNGDRKAIDEKDALEAAQLGMTLEQYRSALKAS